MNKAMTPVQRAGWELAKERNWEAMTPAQRQALEWSAQRAEERWGGEWAGAERKAAALAVAPDERAALELLQSVVPARIWQGCL